MKAQTKRDGKKELQQAQYRANRKRALKRDRCCRMCGSTQKLECHHIRPRCLGVDHRLANLAILCQTCHKQIHRMKAQQVWQIGKLAFATTYKEG